MEPKIIVIGNRIFNLNLICFIETDVNKNNYRIHFLNGSISIIKMDLADWKTLKSKIEQLATTQTI